MLCNERKTSSKAIVCRYWMAKSFGCYPVGLVVRGCRLRFRYDFCLYTDFITERRQSDAAVCKVFAGPASYSANDRVCCGVAQPQASAIRPGSFCLLG